MYYYCIIYEGQYSDRLSYVEKENISELAIYLNEVLLRRRTDVVKAVYLTKDYDTKFDCKVFLQTEYNEQFFLERYEARLLEQYRLDKLAV